MSAGECQTTNKNDYDGVSNADLGMMITDSARRGKSDN